MPTVAELTDELRRLGGSGYSGKKKAELEVMLVDLKKFLASKKAPAAEAPKKAAEAAPAPPSAHAESMAKKAKPAKTGAVSTPLSALSAGPAKKSLAEEKAELEKEHVELEAKINKYKHKITKVKQRISEINSAIKADIEAEEVRKGIEAKSKLSYFHELGDFIKDKNPKTYKSVMASGYSIYVIPYSDMPDSLVHRLKEKYHHTRVIADIVDPYLMKSIKYNISLEDDSVEIQMEHGRVDTEYLRRDVFETVANILSIDNERLPKLVLH